MAGTPGEPTPRRTVGGDQTTSEHATWIIVAIGWTFILGFLAWAVWIR